MYKKESADGFVTSKELENKLNIYEMPMKIKQLYLGGKFGFNHGRLIH